MLFLIYINIFVATDTPASINEQFKRCCTEHGLSADCQTMCHYNLTVDLALTLANTCIPNLANWAECGAGMWIFCDIITMIFRWTQSYSMLSQ
jgi:hypothetical protein